MSNIVLAIIWFASLLIALATALFLIGLALSAAGSLLRSEEE
jgi:hypothetical protein